MYWIALWCMLVSLASGKTNSNCTSNFRCACFRSTRLPNKWKADCSNRNLTTSPVFSADVVEIDLSCNNLSSFPARSNIPREILKLDISRNSLKTFSEDSFRNLSLLEELSIENNQYDLNSTVLSPGIFKDLIGLKFLNIKRRGSNDDNYPENALSDLVSLQTLLINGRKNGFGPKFRNLKNLTLLDLSGKKGNNCSVGYFHPGYFGNVTIIRNLDVSLCKLKYLLANTFSGLRQLEELDISENEELSFSILRNVSSDLRSTAIRVFKFNKIHCTFGIGTDLYISDIIALQNTSLKAIHVNSNRLETIQSGVLMYMPRSLEHIFVADNRLTMGMYALETANLVGLKTFDMSMQYSSHNPNAIFSRCNDTRGRQRKNGNSEIAQLQKIHASSVFEASQLKGNSSHNKGISFPADFGRLESEQNIFHDYGLQSPFPFPFPFFMPLPQHAETAYFNRSTFRYPLPHTKIGNNKLKHIYAQDNVLYEWIGPMENLENVEVLDLSNNFCSNVSTFFFDFFKGLKVLKVNDNLLGFSLVSDTEGNTFKYLRNLSRLEMANNRIQNLPEKIFRNTISMEVLILKNNLLRDLKLNLQQMQQLTYLDLSTNQLQRLKKPMMNQLDTIPRTNNFTVDLSGNILQCNCEEIDFLRWMVNSGINFVLKKSDKCLTKFNKTGSMPLTTRKDRGDILLLVEKGCRSYVVLILTLSLVLVVIITTIVCALLFRFRWKLRYLYYMTKSKYRGYASIRPTDEEAEKYNFDAFVSYADEDRSFAFHTVMEKLESDGRLQLCFHSRDFIPGVDIAENITHAVHNSRKTICIVSPHYLESYWCMYELNIGRMESIYSRKGEDVLFLVIYDRFTSSNIPLSMMDLIDKKSYIEYPNDPQGDIVFWRKMYEAIQI